ncbi:DASH complex subunit DAD2 [Fusarium odoratissimum]|uniref:DASH complex subunit DAD2 n=1 Tax=Fusarium oxysporum f. sp. cubense (strain race 4) TaxID=2502994 RepID=N1RDF1_FUSC4|nr:DASH complex subunit DAD2 [Fusarium odoratissimum]
MSYPTRPISSHMRAPSASASSSGQSPALLARIEEKKAELENLKELRELSAAVATQMEALEQKLSTLSDGTEVAIAAVVGNWHNVLRAISMASSKLAKTAADPTNASEDSTGPLPQTLVRIPTEHAPALQAQAEAAEAAAEEEES